MQEWTSTALSEESQSPGLQREETTSNHCLLRSMGPTNSVAARPDAVKDQVDRNIRRREAPERVLEATGGLEARFKIHEVDMLLRECSCQQVDPAQVSYLSVLSASSTTCWRALCRMSSYSVSASNKRRTAGPSCTLDGARR